MKLTVNEILRASADARLPAGAPDTEVEGACVDSREVVEGSLFVGIRGELADGGQHAPDALWEGAAAAVVGESAWRWIEGDVQGIRKPVIVAADPLAVLQAAGRLALERTGARVVAVTGATGQDHHQGHPGGDAPRGRRPGRGHAGEPQHRRRRPDVADGARRGLRGRGGGDGHARHRSDRRARRAGAPDVACVTAIGPVHLELLGTVEAVAAAKAEVLQALRPGGHAVVPADEPLLEPHIAALDPGITVHRFGDAPDLALDLGLAKGWELRNAAAALACCRALGMVPPEGAVIEVTLSALRGQERPLAVGGVLIEDCYNANPVSMRAALADLAGRPGRRVAVLADMMELGPEEARYHREVGEAAAAAGIDLLVAVGERAAGYAQGADGLPSEHFATVEEAIEAVPGLVREGDVVLLKGSRSMRLERVGAVLAPDGSR